MEFDKRLEGADQAVNNTEILMEGKEVKKEDEPKGDGEEKKKVTKGKKSRRQKKSQKKSSKKSEGEEVGQTPEQSAEMEKSNNSNELDPSTKQEKAVFTDSATFSVKHEVKKVVLPDRVQVKVKKTKYPGQDGKGAEEEEFNPNLYKIKVGSPGDTPVSGNSNPGVAMNLQGAQVRVGETEQRAIVAQVAQPTQLPVPAVKVRNIVGEVRDVRAEVIKDKVIIQGIIHKQVFFVGEDGVVRHFSENVPFSTFIDIPGAEPGMNVQVHPIIEKILFHLSENRLSVIQKIILQIFVKVTEFVQTGLTLGEGPLLLLPMVVGEATKQTLVENIVTLNLPALKIDEIRGELREIQVEVIKDKVVVQGMIHKQIFFIDEENLARHQAENLPFSLFLDVPGAEPGMDLQVHPRIEGIFFDLLSPDQLREKVVIEVFVKVTEAIQERIRIGQGPLFKVEQVIGEGQTQILKESVIQLNRPAIKIREIVGEVRNVTAQVIPDKVVVQGIVHKEIFFIGTDNIEYHQAEDVPFSLFLDIPGAAPGLNAKVRPVIEKILFELTDQTILRQKVVLQANVIVTETVQLPLVPGEFSLFKLEQVIGEGIRQILIERREVIPPIPPVVRNVVIVVVVPPAGVITGRQQIIVENVVDLPERAIKIKEVRGVITDVRARVVIPNGVLVEGFVVKEVFFVGEDNIVRSITERIPFSILINVPGITPETPFTVDIEIENISFTLSPDGRFLRQIIVINAEVTAETPAPEPFQVVTSVTGPGITTKTVLVRAPVQTESGVVVKEFPVVTEVSGPGIARVEKAVVLLDVVDDGNPNPVPIEVVTNVIFEPTPLPAVT